jgi:hypothetical protein
MSSFPDSCLRPPTCFFPKKAGLLCSSLGLKNSAKPFWKLVVVKEPYGHKMWYQQKKAENLQWITLEFRKEPIWKMFFSSSNTYCTRFLTIVAVATLRESGLKGKWPKPQVFSTNFVICSPGPRPPNLLPEKHTENTRGCITTFFWASVNDLQLESLGEIIPKVWHHPMLTVAYITYALTRWERSASDLASYY